MPNKLLNLHQELDLAVENCYNFKANLTDEDKLKDLFELHKSMTQKEVLL